MTRRYVRPCRDRRHIRWAKLAVSGVEVLIGLATAWVVVLTLGVVR